MNLELCLKLDSFTYGEISDFKNVFELLDKVCDEISKELLNEKN